MQITIRKTAFYSMFFKMQNFEEWSFFFFFGLLNNFYFFCIVCLIYILFLLDKYKYKIEIKEVLYSIHY